MAICKEKDRNGRVRYVVSKRWPEGSGRVRKYAPTHRAARELLTRIESSILNGSWRQLKKKLSGRSDQVTIKQFYQRFLEEYCKPRMKSWDRYQLSFKSLNRRLGNVRLKNFNRQMMHSYVKSRLRQVSPATVNRDIAAIRKMFSHALECGVIDSHPLIRFRQLKEPEKAFVPLDLKKYRELVEATDRESLQATLAVIGETGLRRDEALMLLWRQVDLKNRVLSVEGAGSKNSKVRQIPLSEYALYWLTRTVRYLRCPFVFVNEQTGKPWVTPTKALRRACQKVGVQVTFHDLRRFRCTRWLMAGVDVRTVKELMGHADISTTMRYAAYLNTHAVRSLKEAQRLEEAELERETNGRQAK